MTFKTLAVAAALSAVALPSAANAATLIVNVAGAQSVGVLGTAGNTVASYLIGANARVTGISYNVTLTANTPSWLSEAGFSFTDSARLDGVSLTPGVGRDNPGTGTFTGSANLIDLGLDFFVGANGLLRTEFFETFNDASVTPDAVWDSGSITIIYEVQNTAVPEPATWAMMIVGFGAIGAAMRRRTKLTVRYA